MEYVQPWSQQRNGFQPGVGYRPGPGGGIQRTSHGVTPQPSVPAPQPARSTLTREERQEAKRLAEEANFSFDGYQVVRREFMSHRFDPAMTIRGNSITFNNSCISKLEDATYIQFLINPEERKLAIRPCDEGARDAVRWCVIRGDKRKSREISCRPFTTKLYELMGWESMYRYKLQGMRITYQGECLYLFDLSAQEAFLPQFKDPETGKRVSAKPVLPKEWIESFGLPYDEHNASTQIDLSEGFVSPDIPGGKEETGDTLDTPVVYETMEENA